VLGACSAPTPPAAPAAPAADSAPAAPGGGSRLAETSEEASLDFWDDATFSEFMDDDVFWGMLEGEDWLNLVDDEALFELWAELQQDTGPYFAMPIITPGDESGRMLVYNVNMRLQTSEMMSGWRLMHNTTGRLGGEIEHAIFYGRDKRQLRPENMRAFFALRIPTENLAEFIELVENNYSIWWLEMRVEDETVTYRRIDTALEGLQNEEAQLIEALENELTPEEEQAMQGQLAAIRGQLADLQVAGDQLVRDVIYSTVIIEMFEAFSPEVAEEVLPLTHGERLGETTFAIVEVVLIFATTVLPVVLALLLIAGIVLVIVRLVSRLRQRSKLGKFLSGEQPRDQDLDK